MTCRDSRRSTRYGTAAVALVVTALLAGGCGGGSPDDDAAPAAAPSASVPGMDTGAMDADGMDMDGMAMGDPSATPAHQLAGAELKEARFALLDTRPPGTDTVAGTAWLAQHHQGTTVTVEMTGLRPGHRYLSHLHAQPCAVDGGGPHFQFDPAGPVTPPNEIHLFFAAGPDGTARTTVSNDRRVEDRAKAIVVHPADAMDNKLACADF